MTEELHKEIKKNYIMTLLEKKERVDGRAFTDYREISVQPGVVETAEGSALARIGKTQIIAGIKFEIVEPFASDPELGVLITNGELLPMASESFEPGPPSETSIEFSRVVDRGIRHSEILPLDKFFIEDGKVLALFLDLYVLDYSGNLIDTGALAAMAALLNTKVPKVEDGKIIREETTGYLELKSSPVLVTTFAKLGNYAVVDPSLEEEIASDSTLSIGTIDDYMVSAQKSGVGTFSRDEVLSLIDTAFEKRKDLLKYLNNIRE